jgi:hypothetical protein
MRQFKIKIIDHHSYLVRYKVTAPGTFVIFLNEDGGIFDEDDCIIQMCQKNFKQVVLEPFPQVEESVPANLEMLNWV